MKKYGVKAVPTTIIDGSIRIEGIPDFPWICGEDLFQKLERDYRLTGTRIKFYNSLCCGAVRLV
jgi:hypothetical protein